MDKTSGCTWSRVVVVTLVLASTLIGPAAAQSGDGGEDRSVQVAMKNVLYHFTDRITAHIGTLAGRLLPTDPNAIVVFDDKNSFILAIDSGEIAISCASMTQVLNQDVFSAADSPIKDVGIESKNNQLLIKGRLPKKLGVSFEATGTLSTDNDGRIRLHTDNVKSAHVPVKGLLDLMGLDLSKFIDTRKIHGVSIDKDDILLDPIQILPPPHIRGKVVNVRLQGNEIALNFGTARGPTFAAKQSGNYMAYRDHDLRFGKLTMHDADLTLIDMDPRDPFDFYLDHYKDQLVAGYSKTTPESGLRVYMPDYGKLKRQAAGSGTK